MALDLRNSYLYSSDELLSKADDSEDTTLPALSAVVHLIVIFTSPAQQLARQQTRSAPWVLGRQG
jgi:hypothetical protein